MIRKQRLAMAGAMACSAAFATGVMAHHGWSGYQEELLKVSGVIEQSSYTSPHGSVHLKAPEKTWVVVLAPPSRMTNRGLTEEMLKVGSKVSVEGYENKTDQTEMRAERIIVEGKTVELR
jgi:hypothetical protein